MAEPQAVTVTRQALEQLADELTCGICFEAYDKPKLLNCAHVFCEGCIERLVAKNRGGRKQMICPYCRKATPLGVEGVASLQKAFYINSLAQIQDTLEKGKEREIEAKLCPLHGDKELEFYCNTCDVMICARCTLRGHCGHQYQLDGEEELSETEKQATAALEPVNAKLIQTKSLLEQVKTSSALIVEQRCALVAEVDALTEAVMGELKARRAELLHQVYHATRDKLLEMSTIQQGLIDARAKLRNCLTLWESESKSDEDQDQVKSKLEAITSGIKMEELELPGVFNFSISTTIPDGLFRSIGKLGEPHHGHPKSYATGGGISRALVGERATATLHTVDEEGKPCVKPFDSILCKFEPLGQVPATATTNATNTTAVATATYDTTTATSNTTATATAACNETATEDSCSVTFVKGNEYEITYTPSSRGRHHLHVQLEGSPIRGSPFSVLVKTNVQQLGPPFRIIENIRGAPYGLAINRKGQIIVSRVGQNNLAVLDLDEKVICTFGNTGSGEGDFVRPYGLAVDGDGNILVADNGNNRIQKFTCNGTFMASVGQKGTGPLEFDCPRGVSYNPRNGKVYVADMQNCRIQVLNHDLTFSSFIGSKGPKDGELFYPWATAFDSEGHCYVADISNKRIQVFADGGRFLRVIGGKGSGAGELDSPSGLAIDEDCTLYVTDLKAHRVMVYSREGTFLTSFGSPGKEPGQLDLPHAIALDKDGRVYVSDFKNLRIQCF